MNKVILIGRVGQDPETKTFDNGNKMSKFSLATSERWKDKDGEKQEKTEWHNITVFNKLQEVVENYVKKGQLLAIEGKIQTRTYDKDGDKKYFTEIQINSLEMLGSKSDNQASEPKVSKKDPVKVEAEPDDLPF